MLTIIADSNIAHLHDYFNAQTLQAEVNVIAMIGREITADILAKYQPDALLIRSVTPINQALLVDNHSVKFVGSATIGTDHVDQAYLASRGIVFANASGCSKHSVAQYVLTAILTLRPQYLSKQNPSLNAQQSPSPSIPTTPIIGIIGLGNIGSTLAKYAQDLGWQVLGYDPLLPPSDINNASLDKVLMDSDAVSLHVPLTFPTTATNEQSPYPTYHLINGKTLAKMPTDSLLINSARGQVVSESNLLADIANTGRTVVLDVFEHEPMVSEQLLSSLAIATPHIAGYTLEGKLRGTQMIFDAFVQTLPLTPSLEGRGKYLGEKDEQDNSLPLGGRAREGENLFNQLLPPNPYHWQDLKNKLKSQSQEPLKSSPKKLAEFYDIMADDKLLRNAVDKQAGQVNGDNFDKLRKNYLLRREWLFD